MAMVMSIRIENRVVKANIYRLFLRFIILGEVCLGKGRHGKLDTAASAGATTFWFQSKAVVLLMSADYLAKVALGPLVM